MSDRIFRHHNGRRFRMIGAQVNQEALFDAAELLSVPLRKDMRTGQMLDAIVNDSFGRPSASEQRGLDRIRGIVNAELESDEGNPAGQEREDIWDALAWLARKGKRKT